ncbi:3-phosphoshikimate 1-carboxyvinyltransferase [bacterium]|nr:MAG: 3-phosphoshikimate 1-carboxyvinyltransferase [bacterium]
MASQTILAGGPLKGTVTVPGDKSISHRSLMFSALAEGVSTITGLQKGLDVKATRQCFEALGVKVFEEGGVLKVEGRGIGGLSEPTDILDCLNSGTTMRLMAGVLAGHSFLSVLTGDRHLRKRPMARILDPLREMGALALGREEDTKAPLVIRGGSLRALEWTTPVASAQVKSAVLLAGLHARGTTWVIEPSPTRDHTERMLGGMGATILREGAGKVGIAGRPKLRPIEIEVPGDPSSAAFWASAALMVPGSDLTVKAISMNEGRTGFFRILKRMGADLEMTLTGDAAGEPVGDLRVRYSKLRGVEVSPEEVPSAIDEFPVLGAIAAIAEGETVVTGAEELRFKESDRIDALAGELRKAGVKVDTFRDGLRITGGGKLNSAAFDSHGDHRLAMSAAILSLALPGGGVVEGAEAAEVSYPEFFKTLSGLSSR